MAVTHDYFKKENDKVLKFHVYNSSFFEISGQWLDLLFLEQQSYLLQKR